jgi:beta-glucanase (GH16 family)
MHVSNIDMTILGSPCKSKFNSYHINHIGQYLGMGQHGRQSVSGNLGRKIFQQTAKMTHSTYIMTAIHQTTSSHGFLSMFFKTGIPINNPARAPPKCAAYPMF